MSKSPEKATMEEVWTAIKASEESRRRGEEALRESQLKTEESQRKTEESQRKTKESQRKTEESQRKTEESLQLTQKEVRLTQREVQKTQKEVQKTQKEVRLTQKEVQKTQKEIRELNNSLKEANGNFNNKWGRFLENLLEGDLVKLLNKWNIKVDRIIQRFVVKRPDGTISAEYDLLAINGKEIVLVEVKTTLSKDDVGRFFKKLKEFKNLCQGYQDKTLYGAVAYMSIKNPDYSKEFKDLNSSETAQDKGLFLIKSPGGATDVSIIANKTGFKPAEF